MVGFNRAVFIAFLLWREYQRAPFLRLLYTVMLVSVTGILSLSLIGENRVSEELPVYPFHFIEERLKWSESRNFRYARSRAGALGLYQIMPVVVRDYNRYSPKYRRYSHGEMVHPRKARLVFRWQMKRLFRLACSRYTEYDRIMIYIVNSYNMGPTGTDLGYYKPDYLQEIIPAYWQNFCRDKKFIELDTINGVVWKLVSGQDGQKAD